jgi:hypothetical protein
VIRRRPSLGVVRPDQTANISRSAIRNEKIPRASAKAMPTKRLAIWPGSRRVAQGARQEVAGDVAHADAGAAQTDGCKAGADVFAEQSEFAFHDVSPMDGMLEVGCRTLVVGVADSVAQVHAGQNGEDVGLDGGDQEFEPVDPGDGDDRDDGGDTHRLAKPAKTLITAWPAIMLPPRRTEWLSGRTK